MLPAAAGSQPAVVPAPPPAASEPAPQTRLAPLLGLVLSQLFQRGFEAATGESVPGLFDRLWKRVRDGTAAGPATDVAPPAPAMGYVIQQLEPADFAVRRQLMLGVGDPVLRTGDVFALQYSTSLPGLVRLENVDVDGRVAHLGTYAVHADQLNRLPADKGIRLEGKPGLEQLRMYFYPCLPPDAPGRPYAERLAGVLPPCWRPGGGAPPTETAALGLVRPRAMVNLSQPDPAMAFAGSDAYRPGEVLVTEARIRHEGPQP